MDIDAQKKYDTKVKRMQDALALKTPDKVPIDISGGEFMIQRLGYTLAESNYDESLEIVKEAATKFMLDYDPDVLTGIGNFAGEGPGFEKQGCNTMFIAGMKNGRISDDSIPQFVEFPTLHDDEFDEFENNYTQWALNKFLPRLSTVMEPFSNFKLELSHRGINFIVDAFSKPEIREAIQKLWEIDDFYKTYRKKTAAATKELMNLGFPSFGGGRAVVPFDKYSDTYRGMQLGFEDLYFEEDFVSRFCEKFHKEQLSKLANDNKDGKKNGKQVAMALHKGSDDMMGNAMYEKVYWRHLKEIIQTVSKTGMICNVFCEGVYDNKLGYLAEVEKGSAYYTFDKIDIKKAKDTLGGICCIGGGFPSPLLVYGTPQKVEEELKKFLDIAMPGGGYIFRMSAGLNGAKPENVDALFKVLHNYGKY